MTLVFRASSGPLTQVQIGPADVLATFAAAYAASGWLGGIDGIRNVISWSNRFLPPASREKQIKLLQGLFREDLKLQSAVFHILSSEHGPVRCEIPTSQTAFGGDQIPKIIGFTICALAHEGGYEIATELFADYLAPLIFDGAAELIVALQSQLHENNTMNRLLNEGATLGLPTIFLEVSRRLGFPTGDEDWLNRNIHINDDRPRPTEWHFVVGLLRWLGNGMKTPYFTRSGLVARVAGYLQAVGYRISSILRLEGSQPRPHIPNPQTVVLVLGGSEETDTLMEDISGLAYSRVVMHYTYDTVGAMLHQSLSQYTTTAPELFQSDFEEIYGSIELRLRTEYYLKAVKAGGTLCVACNWKPPSSPASPIAIRLAGIYFPLLADEVAPCYERIATDNILSSVKNREKREALASAEGFDQAIVRFRECTAAILISLIASLSRDDFRKFKHSTMLDLSHSVDLEQGCRFTDRSFSSSVKFDEAVQLLATIHAARRVEFSDSDPDRIIGWRNGIYCVIPNLLLDMRPTAESITLACRDVFYANIRVHDNGSMKSAVRDNLPDTVHLEDRIVSGAELSVMEMSKHPWVGRAQTTPPDKPLYLGLERPLHYNDPDICLVGRVDGNAIGTVAVDDVLKGIARSLLQAQECRHDLSMDVVNVQTSAWIVKKGSIPVGSKETPALLSVKDDPSWALFAIGQSFCYQTCIVLRCNDCALHAATEHGWMEGHVVLIGYH